VLALRGKTFLKNWISAEDLRASNASIVSKSASPRSITDRCATAADEDAESGGFDGVTLPWPMGWHVGLRSETWQVAHDMCLRADPCFNHLSRRWKAAIRL
jgi:hypothetical protein